MHFRPVARITGMEITRPACKPHQLRRLRSPFMTSTMPEAKRRFLSCRVIPGFQNVKIRFRKRMALPERICMRSGTGNAYPVGYFLCAHISPLIDFCGLFAYFLSMETIFDIATEAELLDLLGEDLPGGKVPYEAERHFAKNSPDANNQMLAQLYAGRGDMKRADEYLEKIKNQQYRLDIMLSLQDLASIQ